MAQRPISFPISRDKAFSLLEVLIVIILISLIVSVGSIPVIQRAVESADLRTTALMMQSLSSHIQGWAIETGRTALMELDLSNGAIAFYQVDDTGERQEVAEKQFRKRQLGKDIRFKEAVLNGETYDGGKLYIPYYPTGYSEAGAVYLQNSKTNEIWTVYFMKFYGDTEIYPDYMPLEDIRHKIENPI